MNGARRGRLARSLLLVPLLAVAVGCSDDSGDGASDEAGGADTTVAPASAEAADATDGAAGASEPADEPVDEPVDERAWPDEAWSEATAADAGLDQAALDQLAATAERGGSECLVVTKDGELVGEWYWRDFGPDTEREVWSVTKSITSTLVGIAQDRGLLDIDEPASTYIEAWRGTPSEAVTIRNLLSNDSGRFHDLETDYVELVGQAQDKTAFSVGLSQQHEPGTTWAYNNAAIQTLEAVLEVATGEQVGAFAADALFEPLGMDASMKTDAAGNALTFMGAQASCRDLARFGLLFLRGGEWDGEQVVSAEWVAEATSPSQEVNPGYGFLWWLNRSGGTGTDAAAGTGSAIATTGDTYAALGLHNQLVAVLPDDGLVATRLGAGAGDDGSGFGLGQLVEGLQAARR